MREGRLNVAVLGPVYADSFAENIAESFVAEGIGCTLVDTRGLLTRSPRIRGWKRTMLYTVEQAALKCELGRRTLQDRAIEARLAMSEPDLVLSVDAYLLPAQIERWRALTSRATWALWYPDPVVNLGPHVAVQAPYDALFFKDGHIVDLWSRRTALSVHYLPEACNPIWHRTETPTTPEEHDQYACDIVVVGNIYPYREHILDRLPPSINLRIYGNLSRYVRSERVRRAYTGRYVTKREKALAFGRAKIVLNTLHYGEIRSLNARLFEATACGGFVLTHASPALDQCFVPGEEVIAFETPAELVDAISAYLADDETRRRVAARGQQRSHQDHTYAHRLREILGICHLSADTSLIAAARDGARLGAGDQLRPTR